MYTEDDYAPLLTKHNITEEAQFLAKYLNQDIWVITRLLREYWKDKLGIEWTIKDIKTMGYHSNDFTDDDALEILKNTSEEYVKAWGVSIEDIDHSIEIYEEAKRNGFKDEDEIENDLSVLYPQG